MHREKGPFVKDDRMLGSRRPMAKCGVQLFLRLSYALLVLASCYQLTLYSTGLGITLPASDGELPGYLFRRNLEAGAAGLAPTALRKEITASQTDMERIALAVDSGIHGIHSAATNASQLAHMLTSDLLRTQLDDVLTNEVVIGEALLFKPATFSH